MTELTLGEFKTILNYMLDNNKRLVESGDTPIAVCLEGPAGGGKTSVVKQVAEEKGMTFVKINLAQIEEPAELVGFPFKEYKIITEHDGVKEAKWMPADLLKEMNCEYIATSESRMSYAVPAWVPREFNPNGTMLVLDDFSRANSLIMQAIMEIINTGSYVSWALPKFTSIVLTSNPDNSEYNVTSYDSATASRLVKFNSRFEIKEWAKWAEGFGIDGRAINFALLYPDEIFETKNNVTIANARSYTTFCRSIAGLKNWEEESALGMILEIASGCFMDPNNTIGALFTTFINNKLDKLVAPEVMVNSSWETASKAIENCVYDKTDGKFRADLASVLGTRFMNYANKNLQEGKIKAADLLERIKQLCDAKKAGKPLFSEDIIWIIARTLTRDNNQKTSSWSYNPWFRDLLLREV